MDGWIHCHHVANGAVFQTGPVMRKGEQVNECYKHDCLTLTSQVITSDGLVGRTPRIDVVFNVAQRSSSLILIIMCSHYERTGFSLLFTAGEQVERSYRLATMRGRFAALSRIV